MIVKLLNEHHLECLSLKEGCRGLSESTLVKMSNCWKSDAAAQSCLKGTATLMITMFYMKDLNKPLILIPVASKSVIKRKVVGV